MRKRRPSSTSGATPSRSKAAQSKAHDEAALITRRRTLLAREWVPLPTQATALGFDWRTLRKYVQGEPFVRVLGNRWYLHRAEFLAWWAKQRPRLARRGT